MERLTKEQAIVLSAVTGTILIQPFQLVLKDIGKRLGREVTPQEFVNPEFITEIQELYRSDLMKLVVMEPAIFVSGLNHG